MKRKRIGRAMFAKIGERVLERSLPTLWYENANGDKWVPDLTQNGPPEAPKGYKYQWSRFPTMLRENCLGIIQQEDVDACDHPKDWRRVDHGLLPQYEGEYCDKCGGSRQRTKGEKWPQWQASGSRNVMGFEMGWSEDLVLALVSEKGFDLSQAIIAAATACERCMNVMAYEAGLEWGYPWGSEEWKQCGTECDFCRGDS
jgi:hypothetical protein